MKTILPLLTITLAVVTSCTSEIEKLQETAITEVKQTLLDPKSFKLIETQVDTIRESHRMIVSTTAFTEKMEMYNTKTDALLSSIRISHIYGMSASSEIAEAQVYIDSATALSERANLIVEKAEKLKNTPNDSVIGYRVNVRYYANTRGGKERMGEQVYTKYNNGETKLQDNDPVAEALSSL